VLAGVVCGPQPIIDEVRAKMSVWGQAPDPFALWLLERGLKTLDVRVQRHNASALRLAQWAQDHAAIRSVLYPGLASHPDHDIARATMDGFGGMVALVVDGGGERAARVISRLSLFTSATSLGGVESLVSEPRLTSHRHLSAEQLTAIGVPDGFIRLSVGLEDADDLIDDLARALES
jgi:cystathionine beta-lyase/cystathionine gamma-synthase